MWIVQLDNCPVETAMWIVQLDNCPVDCATRQLPCELRNTGIKCEIRYFNTKKCHVFSEPWFHRLGL